MPGRRRQHLALLCRSKKVIIRGVLALGFGVFVCLVANVITGLAAMGVHALNRGDMPQRTLPGVRQNVDPQPGNGL